MIHETGESMTLCVPWNFFPHKVGEDLLVLPENKESLTRVFSNTLSASGSM